ncbi:hypothetical protein BJV77DRAFT_1066350 [Russula vinacea]|nr:hypothetical protein BJV77DRAFT_1066350 [Russula vinacea]
MGDGTSTTILSLTDLGNGGPAATEVIKYLVQAVGRDVVSFQRNTQVSYMAVERARDILKQINDYIDKVENSIGTAEDWDNFEKFTTAIDPLEEILSNLLLLTKDEKEQHFAKIDSIGDCVTSAVHWVHHRQELFKALGDFDTSIGLDRLSDESRTQTREHEHKEAQFNDDKAFLEELGTTTKNVISKDSIKFPSYLQAAEASLESLQNAVINGSTSSTPEWLRVTTIQTSILVEGVVKIMEVTPDTKILSHLKSKPVWTAASELTKDLRDNLNNTPSILPESVKKKYDALVKLLPNSCDLALPEAYVELIKKVGHIRRPFQAQAIALARLCHFLAGKFNETGASITVEGFNSLDEAFDKTLAVLEAAINVVSDLRTFDTANFDEHPTLEEFTKAEGLIKKGFKPFSLDAEWSSRQSDLVAARNKDKKRMEELSSLYSQNPSDTTKKVMVNVNIHCESGNSLGKVSVEEDETTRLLALRWRVASVLKPDEMKRARDAGTFFKEDGRSKLALQSQLSQLEDIVRDSAGKSEVTLRLVVPGPVIPETAARDVAAVDAAARNAAAVDAAARYS